LYFKTGKVKFTYRYYPVVDQGRIGESHWAAYAAECANEQGRFWDYHDKLFAVWTGENVGTYTKDKLKSYAVVVGLDTEKFNTCVDTEKTKPVIDADQADVTRLGISGTPTFLVNGRALQIRSLDVSEFSRSLDLFLK
jgi:protein-disulfide isomerase